MDYASERVKEIANRHGWSAAELGRQVSVSRAHAGRLLKGERPVTRDVAEALAKIERCHPAEILWDVVILRNTVEEQIVRAVRNLKPSVQKQVMTVAEAFYETVDNRNTTDARKDAAD